MTPPRLKPGMVVFMRLLIEQVDTETPWGETVRAVAVNRKGQKADAGFYYVRAENVITPAEAKALVQAAKPE